METTKEVLTLETLPKAFGLLTAEVSEIKKLLLERSENKPEPDKWFNLEQLREYLPDKPKAATIYAWVHTESIPVNKGSKKLRFLKSEIDAWLKTGRKKTVAEIAAEADNYLKKKGAKNA